MTERCKRNPCCGDLLDCKPPPQFKPRESYEEYQQRSALSPAATPVSEAEPVAFPAVLADAHINPPLSDLSSLRKGVEVVGEAAAYDFVAGWHERQAKLFREMADDDPRTAEPQRKRAFEAAIHHAASAAALRNRAADDRRAALVSGSREDGDG